MNTTISVETVDRIAKIKDNAKIMQRSIVYHMRPLDLNFIIMHAYKR